MNVPAPLSEPSDGPPMTTTDAAGALRPLPAPSAPPRQALREVYERLLAIEQARLEVAVRIERERGIVFPETSVIVRDVRTLAERLYGPSDVPGATPAATSPGPARAPAEASAPSSPPEEGGDDGGEGAAGEVDSFLLELEGQAMAANGSAGGRRGARR